jgi:hypothetical protein
MLRPFKPLLCKAEEIQDVMSEIQDALEVIISERADLQHDDTKGDSKLNDKDLQTKRAKREI